MSEAGPATVVVEPSGVKLEVEPGETVMAAAIRLGFRWPTTCGGEGTCTVCMVRILEGATEVVAPRVGETERLKEVGRFDPQFRLACQLVVTGDVRLEKRGVRPVTPAG